MKSPAKSRAALKIAVLAVACVCFMGAGDTTARFGNLGHKLMCKCGCNQVLLECNHVGCEYSERMRGELMAGIDRGDSDDLVLQSFVQKYGATVLAAPTTTGFNRIAWIMPYAALLVGITAVVLVIRVWKQKWTPATAGAPAIPASEAEAFRRRAREETEL